MTAPPDSAPALALAGVRRRFPIGLGLRKKEVLHGVELTLGRGQTLGLVGPNGSGKSTLLRIVAGVDRATAGVVSVLGGSPLTSAVRARLAYLPEDSPFPSELSGRAALDLLGALAGLKRAVVRARGAALLEQVGLADVARQPLRSYSRGMLRRFGLAQAFLSEPDLVLLDEPTAGLDAPGFAVLEELLRAARGRGATVVLASHLLSDVHDHCDRLAVLVEGRVAGAGTPDELLGVEGRRVLEVDGLDELGLGRLATWLEDAGGTLVSARAGGRSLLELYAEKSG